MLKVQLRSGGKGQIGLCACVCVCVVQNVPLHGEEDWGLMKVPLIGSWRPQLSISQLASDDAASAGCHWCWWLGVPPANTQFCVKWHNSLYQSFPSSRVEDCLVLPGRRRRWCRRADRRCSADGCDYPWCQHRAAADSRSLSGVQAANLSMWMLVQQLCFLLEEAKPSFVLLSSSYYYYSSSSSSFFFLYFQETNWKLWLQHFVCFFHVLKDLMSFSEIWLHENICFAVLNDE